MFFFLLKNLYKCRRSAFKYKVDKPKQSGNENKLDKRNISGLSDGRKNYSAGKAREVAVANWIFEFTFNLTLLYTYALND